MDVDEASKALGVSTKTLRNYIKKGLIEARMVEGKTGKEYEIDSSSLEAFKAQKSKSLVFPVVEEVEEPGTKTGKLGKTVARVEKPGPLEVPSFQGGVIYLGPPRASEAKRYIDSLPDILTVKEVAEFLGVGASTVRDYLRAARLSGMKIGRGWKVSKGSLKAFVKDVLG